MFDRINMDIVALEQNVTKAEEQLGYNKTGIKGFFKPLLGKIVKNDRNRNENINDTKFTYIPTTPFKASHYFGESSMSLSHETETEPTSSSNTSK